MDNLILFTGADLGEGWLPSFPQGFNPLPTQRLQMLQKMLQKSKLTFYYIKIRYNQFLSFSVIASFHTICTILRYLFLVMDPKIFLKTPSAPTYTNFEGGARAEKKNFFLVQIFKMVPKNGIFDLLFQNFASGAEILVQYGLFTALRELGILKICSKTRPPFSKKS